MQGIPDLGSTVRDSVSGFVGKVEGLATYRHDSPRVWVVGIDASGKPIEEWFPVERVEPAE